ncbi:hypothetical protein CHISP_2030 [Chitinispirillum alkaliphilum]|nr:hypothetical protein CHISP_2030 [Chitinispirillum alkaliphilum]
MKLNSLLTVTALGISFLLSCAHQGTPGGGPKDTTPPTVESTYPVHRGTDIANDSRIVINFSKWIDPASVQRSVSVFPALQEGVDLNVSGRRLTITPKENFLDSTTYHVVIDGSLKDLRGNSLKESYNLVFSTGSQLDRATLSGCVVDDRFSTLPKAALFRYDSHWHDSLYFSTPDYITGVDSSGHFSFSHLRAGEYRAIAFIDMNNDGLLQPSEICFSPIDSVITVDDNNITSVLLYPSSADTLPPALASVQAISGTVIRGNWNKPLDTDHFEDKEFMINPVSDTSRSPEIKNLYHLEGKMDFILTLQDTLENTPYHLAYRLGSVHDSLRFNGVSLADTVNPALLGVTPDNQIEPDPELNLIWSEPVRADQNALYLLNNQGDTVFLEYSSTPTDTLLTRSSALLKPDSEYRLKIQAEGVRDLAGNSLYDTALTEGVLIVDIATISAENLATRIHGTVDCLTPDRNRKWLFKPLSSERVYISDDHNGYFRFDSIPAGNGKIAWFLDQNGNGKWDRGRLSPWRAPEPYVTLDDTVEARARWEIDNILINGCGMCGVDKANDNQ